MSPKRVSEPVQVYLDRDDQRRLERLARQLDTSKSEILRKGIGALERQLLDPNEHPALRVVGLGVGRGEPELGYDEAREHDRYLADSEQRGWSRRGRR